jgi:hypothetical protein
MYQSSGHFGTIHEKMETAQTINYPLVPVIDRRWIRLQGETVLDTANGLKRRVRWYFECCLGIPWHSISFDKAYFAEKMREARKRKEKALERRRSLVPNRDFLQRLSTEVEEKDFGIIDDILHGDNNLGMSKEMLLAFYARPDYSYERHKTAILDQISNQEYNFNDLPKVVAHDGKLNRIFNFITIIFLQHYRLITIRQSPPDPEIWIRKANYINVTEEIWD